MQKTYNTYKQVLDQTLQNNVCDNAYICKKPLAE